MTASSSSSWTNTAGGLWDGANWSNGVPTSSTAATISGTSTFTVTVEAGLAAAAAALVINDANATVNDLGSLALGTGLTLTAGTFALGAGGVLSGGTVTLGTGGHLLNQGGTLSGLTYDGTLDLSQAAAAVTLSGVTLAGATGGTSSGTINLTGAGADLFELGTGTLNTALLNFGNATTAVTLSALDVGGAGVLTLGSKLSATLTTGSALIADAGGAGDGIINAGTLAIAATAKTSAVNIQGNSFKNTGLFTVSGGTVVWQTRLRGTSSGRRGPCRARARR